MSNYQLVTWMGKTPDPVSEPYYTPQIFFASCRKYGVEPIVLGQGEWGGLGSKVKTLKRAIDSGLLTADYLILSDSFDVVYTCDLALVVDRFTAIQQLSPATPSIIWNAEKSCFPRPHLADQFPQVSSPFKYLNSGWGIGELEGIKKVFAEEDPELILDDHIGPDGQPRYDDDQRWWQDRFLHGSVSIGLDTQTELCAALHDTNEDEIELIGDQVKIKATGNVPPVLHFNGSGKNQSYKLEIFRRLGF